MYFANVATYLLSVHDDTPLSEDELQGIEPFDKIERRFQPFSTNLTNLHAFLCAWGSLQYNLVTNDGSHAYMHRVSAASKQIVCQIITACFLQLVSLLGTLALGTLVSHTYRRITFNSHFVHARILERMQHTERSIFNVNRTEQDARSSFLV
jgi:hypothetical protein